MANTVAELQEDAKRKMANEKKNQPDPQDTTKKLEEMMSKVTFLEAQNKILQEQSNKNSLNEEEKRLEQDALRMKKEEEALRQEADVARILDEALKTEKPSADAEKEELSQKDLVGIMAETVGKALEASSKLTMSEMDKKMQGSNQQIAAMQKVMVELLSGMSVNSAREKFPDFDKYSEAASKIHAQHSSLSPEQAYQLAKAQAESTQPDKNKVETEKPSEAPAWTPDRPFSTSRGSDLSENEHRPEGNQRQNFRQELSSAVDDYLARKK